MNNKEDNQSSEIVDAPVKTDKLDKEEEKLCRVYWQVRSLTVNFYLLYILV